MSNPFFDHPILNSRGVRPFFCQVEAVETAIWLTEVAPHSKSGKRILELLDSVNQEANPELMRLALKLATGAGKTTSYNPVGSTNHVRFTTSKTLRWETKSDRCHINWIILDSEWEAELCRVAEAHPQVRSYVKNHNLGFEVPYRYGSETRRYLPDFIVLIDDGHGPDDLLHLIVEIKGYRREDAKEKKSTMETYWVPGVNNLKQYGRWAFVEFTEVYQIEADFKAKVENEFNRLIVGATSAAKP